MLLIRACTFLMATRARAGDKVLVHGASGGVGCAAVQVRTKHDSTQAPITEQLCNE